MTWSEFLELSEEEQKELCDEYLNINIQRRKNEICSLRNSILILEDRIGCEKMIADFKKEIERLESELKTFESCLV